MKRLLFSHNYIYKELAILVIRCSLGLLLCYHGLEKFSNYNVYIEHFPNPIGLGTTTSLWLVIFTEFVGGLALVFGVLTRFFLTFIFISLGIAFFVAHAQDPFSAKELALSYWLISIGLFFSGPGNYSLDNYILKKTKSK